MRPSNRLVRAAVDAHREHDCLQHPRRSQHVIQRADSVRWELRQDDPNPGRGRSLSDDRPDQDDRKRVLVRAARRRDGGLFALGDVCPRA